MKRKLLSLGLTLALCLSLIPTALAAGTTVTTAEQLQAAFNKGGKVTLGADIAVQGVLVVAANTDLDLNGYKLMVVRDFYSSKAALHIDLARTLTISDSQYHRFMPGNGKLTVYGKGTGISTFGATLVINSGVVEAKGEFATGIGGRNESGYRDGGTVIINGGVVTATGGCPGTYGGAGIGGMGEDGNGGTITINGGTVTAIGSSYGAGIGGGGVAGFVDVGGGGGTININGGTVKVTGYTDIGGGRNCIDNGTLNITGGTIELLKNGTKAKIFSKNCTITGKGAGDLAGSYDSMGSRVAVNGASGWASDDVASAVAANLVPLSLQSNYSKPATRAEFCALGVAFYEAVTGKLLTERTTFSDTKDENVEKMAAVGVVTGVGDNRFNPNGTLTREQAATMLARLAQAAGEPLPEATPSFADRNAISSWAVQQVGQVQGVGIMNGVGNNLFSPTGTYTVEQSIITMLRLYNALQ